MKISRHQIIAFAAVGRERSFSQAAESLGVGQSAVTQHIAALEEAVGTKLFSRSRAGARLTDVGEELFSIADKLRVFESLFIEKATDYAELSAGELSVCVSTPKPALGLISAFQKSYPGMRIDLTVAPWREALRLIRQRQVDVAVAIVPEKTDGLFCVELEQRQFVAVLPRNHPRSRQKFFDMRDFTNETFISLSADAYTRYCVDKMFSQAGVRPASILTTSSYEMVLESVVHQMGVAIALEGALTRFDEVATIPIRNFREKHAYAVICTEDKASINTVRSFLNLAKIGVRKGREWKMPETGLS